MKAEASFSLTEKGVERIGPRSREHSLRLLRILAHALDQRLGGFETLLAADPADELDLEPAAVEVAREVEQKDFQQRRAVVESRPPAEARDPAADLPRDGS